MRDRSVVTYSDAFRVQPRRIPVTEADIFFHGVFWSVGACSAADRIAGEFALGQPASFRQGVCIPDRGQRSGVRRLAVSGSFQKALAFSMLA